MTEHVLRQTGTCSQGARAQHIKYYQCANHRPHECCATAALPHFYTSQKRNGLDMKSRNHPVNGGWH